MSSASRRSMSVLIVLSLTIGALAIMVGMPSASATAATPTWQSGTALNHPTYLSAYAQIGDVVYVFGGRTNVSTPDLDIAYSYDLRTGVQSDLPKLPYGVSGASAVVGNDGLIYIIGGRNLTAGWFMDTVQIYHPADQTYTRGANMLLGETLGNVAIVPTGQIIVMGGMNVTVRNTVQIYDPASDTWKYGGSMSQASYAAVTMVDGDRILYIGGSDSTNDYKTVYYYSWRYDYWYIEPATLPTTLAAAKGIKAQDGNIYVTGGGTFATSEGGIVKTMYLDTASQTLVGLPDMNTPRKYHIIAESSDHRMFVLGGLLGIGGSVAVTTSVESISLGSMTVAPSASSVGTGDRLDITIATEFSLTSYDGLEGSVRMVDANGTTFDLGSFYSGCNGTLTVEITIPQGASAGTCEIIVYSLVGYRSGFVTGVIGTDHVMTVSVYHQATVQERLTDLQNQNDQLRDQLTQAENKLDQKMDSGTGLLLLVLVCIVLLVVVLQFILALRKKA